MDNNINTEETKKPENLDTESGAAEAAQRKRKGRKLNNILFFVCLIVLICAVGVGVYQGFKKQQANKAYEELRPEVAVQEEEVSVEEEEKVDVPIDFSALQKKYPDAYAWITIPDTPVDYPIMQSSEDMDPDYYLEHTIDGEENLPGAIYTQRTWNTKDLSDPVTVVYGHNMRNDSMFGSLSEYKNEEYREAHPYIFVYTPDHIYKYQVFGAVTYTSDHILSKYNCYNADEYEAFLASLEESSYSPTWVSDEIDVTTDDQVIVLSTCNSNDQQRFLICAVLVEKK